MLPGFNIDKDDQFMAIEGFTAGLHNRSDEAFTIADLEMFKDEKSPKTSYAETTKNEMSKDMTLLKESGSTTTKPTTTTTTTKPKTTNRTTTTKPTTANTGPTTTTIKFDKKQGRNNPKPKKTTTTTTTTTKPSDVVSSNNNLTNDNSESAFRNLEPYEDDENSETPVEMSATMEEEDPENPIDDRGMDDEMSAEVTDEEAIVEEESSDMDDTSITEGFTGSMHAHESWLTSVLKALLLTFIMFVLMHPSSAKILSKFGGKMGGYKEIWLCIIFFILAYVIIIAF